MAITVRSSKTGKTETRSKRTSLKDRDRIKQLNKERLAEGKEELEGTESQKKDFEKELKNVEAAQLAQAQKTVRELNESAERSGSSASYSLVEREGQLQIQKKEIERRNYSAAAGVGGPQQIVPLQSQISRQQETTSVEYLPVGSSREGGVILRESSSGKTFTEVGTSAEGGKILSSTPEFVNSGRIPPDISKRPGSGFAAPGLFISERRREDIRDAGTFLREGGVKIQEATSEAPGVFKVAGGITGYGSRALGAGLERLGADPQKTVAFEVVLPATGGAVLGAASEAVVRGTPLALSSVGFSRSASLAGGRIVGGGLAAAGYASLGGAVLTRSAEEQSPDVIFAGVGARAGARPTTGLDTAFKNPVFYGGAPTPNRAARLGLKTAGKPTTKAEIRKQSFNQAYNPNIYRNAGEFGVKTGKSREFVRFTGSGGAEVGTRVPATELGVRGQSYEAGFKVQPGRQTETFQKFTYSPAGGKPSPIPGSSKSFKAANKPDYKLGYQDTVVAIQQSKGYQAVKVFEQGKRVPVKPQDRFIDQSQFLTQTKTVPQYEFKPNAPAQYSAYAEGRLVGGAQPGRGRVYENILSRIKAKNAARTDFVLVETPVAASPAPSSPVRDLALSTRFDNVPSVASDKGVTSLAGAGSTVTGVRPSGVVYDVKPATVVSKPIQNVKPFTAVIPRQEGKAGTSVAPALSVIAAERLLETPKVFQQPAISTYTVVPPAVKQVPVAAQRSVVEQRTQQLSQTVSQTGFDFKGAPTPNLKFDTPITPTRVNQPGITRKPTKPINPTYRPYREVPLNPPPPRFGFPDKARNAAQYEVQVGSKGNKYFFDLGRGGTEVLTKARDLAKGTAAASIRVKPLGRSSSDVAGLLGSDFVKNKAGVYVQKTETRISSAGEKAQIPGASRNKRLTKGTSYGDALKKVGSGKSLRGVRRGFF